jgi:hypothetical protein
MALPKSSRRLTPSRTLLLCAAILSDASRAFADPSQSPPPLALSQAAPQGREQRIYRGTYYRRGAAASAPKLFWYERWIKEEAGLSRATHTHHALSGGVLLRQSAVHSADYTLSRFESDHRQTGVRVDARVLAPGRVRLQRTSGGKVETVELEHEHPLVVGPTLYGTMLRRWDELARGRTVVVDYLSVERLDTYAFEIRRVASDATTTSFELEPHGFILSLLVAPLRVVFLTRTRQVLRYEGPSPVLLEAGTERESFDARIEYSEPAAVFR